MSMPTVVPATTARRSSNRAARTTVAICVLSPISARKNATTVTTNAPKRSWSRRVVPLPESGRSAHSATAKNDAASIQRKRGRHGSAYPRSGDPGEGVIEKRRNGDASYDGQRLPQACGEHQREQLCLVADLADSDGDRRYQKGFHAGIGRRTAGVFGRSSAGDRRLPSTAAMGRMHRTRLLEL